MESFLGLSFDLDLDFLVLILPSPDLCLDLSPELFLEPSLDRCLDRSLLDELDLESLEV